MTGQAMSVSAGNYVGLPAAAGTPVGEPMSTDTLGRPPMSTGAVRVPVVRLQVQTRPMKQGRAPWRFYDPSCLREVDALRLTPSGVIGVLADGTELIDVHHAAHPESRDRRGLAGISVMATGDYAALRARYGDHLVDGIAGEGVLVEFDPGLARRSMPDSITVSPGGRDEAGSARGPEVGVGPRTSFGDADLVLHSVQVADPCVEFTRFCLRLPASDSVGDDVSRGLDDLRGGARGYKMVAEREWVLRRGDLLLIDLSG
jgi:hypothetical protein